MSETMQSVLMGAFAFALVLFITPTPSLLAKKTPFQPTTISNIADDPVAYDQKKIALSGKIINMEGIRSFRGDVFVSLTLTDENQEDATPTLTVFFWPSRELSVGDIVTVEGRYHVQWRFGGFEHDHFVDASRVKRKGEVEPPPPSSSPRIQL